MRIDNAYNQALALFREVPDRESVQELKEIFALTPALKKALSSPVVRKEEKRRIISAVSGKAGLPEKIENFLFELAVSGEMDELPAIFDIYRAIWNEKNHYIEAEVTFAEQPDDAAQERIVDYLKQKYAGKKIRLCADVDPSLIRGCVIRTRGVELDMSIAGRLEKMHQALLEK